MVYDLFIKELMVSWSCSGSGKVEITSISVHDEMRQYLSAPREVSQNSPNPATSFLCCRMGHWFWVLLLRSPWTELCLPREKNSQLVNL